MNRTRPLDRRRRIVLAMTLVAASVVAPWACGRSQAATVTVDSSLLYRFYGYPDGNSRRGSTENFLYGNLRARGQLGQTAGYRIELDAYVDDAGFTAGVVDPLTEERRRPYLDVPEAVLDWTPSERARISIGRQFVNWSGIDEIQPANLMTPLDESDLFERTQLGAYAVTGHFETQAAAIDLAIVPAVFQLTRLPQGRWRFAPDGVGQRTGRAGAGIEETQVGARIGRHFGDLELAVVGYIGRDMFPLFTLDSSGPAPVAVAHNPRTRAAGITASWAVGESWMLRSEIVYYGSPDSRRDDFFQYVPLGVEYTRGNWRGVLNYLRVDRTDTGVGAVSQGEREFYPSFLFGEGHWDAGGDLRVRLRCGYDFDKHFAVVEPQVSYRVWRDLRFGIVAAVIFADGAQSGYFDQIRHEDRIGLTLQYFH